MAKKSTVGDDFLGMLPWALLGGAAGWGLYMLWKNRPKSPAAPVSNPGVTRPGALPPAQAAPSTYATLASINKRVDEIRELFRMGYQTPSAAWLELDGLAGAATVLGNHGEDADAVAATLDEINGLKAQVQDYIDMETEGVTGPAAMGSIWFAPSPGRR